MRKLFSLIVLFVLLTFLGCSPAKKPENIPAPKTVVMPEVSRISYQSVDYDKAPDIVQALAKNLKGKHFATWTAVNGTHYVIVNQENLPSGVSVVVADIERRIPATDFDWVNVKLKYSKGTNAPDTKKNTDKPIVSSFTLDRTVRALTFEMERETTSTPQTVGQSSSSTATNNKTTGQNTTPKSTVEKGLKLNSPAPGAEVKSPIKVSGSAIGVEGTIRVRVKDSSGLTLAEKPVQVIGGRFNAAMSFTAPTNQEGGTVEAFTTDSGGVEKDNVTNPVTLLPNNVPETIGAP